MGPVPDDRVRKGLPTALNGSTCVINKIMFNGIVPSDEKVIFTKLCVCTNTMEFSYVVVRKILNYLNNKFTYILLLYALFNKNAKKLHDNKILNMTLTQKTGKNIQNYLRSNVKKN